MVFKLDFEWEIHDLWQRSQEEDFYSFSYFKRATRLEAKLLGLKRKGFLGTIERCYSVFINSLWSPIFLYRVAVFIKFKGYGRLASIISRMNKLLNGCDISLSSRIASPCFIRHPTGIVIGSGTIIGPNCQLHGGCQFVRDPAEFGGEDKYPTLGKGVFVGAGAVLIGGIMVGNNTVIGALSKVAFSVPDGVIISSPPAKINRELSLGEDPEYLARRKM